MTATIKMLKFGSIFYFRITKSYRECENLFFVFAWLEAEVEACVSDGSHVRSVDEFEIHLADRFGPDVGKLK